MTTLDKIDNMIIGISGKKQHGKDTVCSIIQYLTTPKEDISYTGSYNSYIMDLGMGGRITSKWQRKLFADKLKDMVCMLIGCTRENLEDNDFKNKELGEEWWYWKIYLKMELSGGFVSLPYNKEENIYQVLNKPNSFTHHSLIKMTPRLILQLLGTEGVRNLIHPNAWSNALMSEYNPTLTKQKVPLVRYGLNYVTEEDFKTKSNEEAKIIHDGDPNYFEDDYPNWIITDVRFPNEVEAIKKKDGILLRIDRQDIISTDTHISETALDDYKFEYTIQNSGNGIEHLIKQVQTFLTHYKLL